MPFTGRLGTQNSKLGDIVLGVVDSFGLGTFGFTVHQIGSRQVRVLFDVPVTDSALVESAYSLTSLAPPGTAVVPDVESVQFFDGTKRSVVVNYVLSLTTGTTYSMQVSGVKDGDGQGVSGAAKNFTANVSDPPHVLGAYLSRRGCVDVVFDRPVGATSPSATAQIRDAAGGPGVAMTLLAWGAEQVLPAESVRFSLPVGTPVADAYEIDFAGIVDESFNSSSGTTDLEMVLRSPNPYDYAKLTQLQLADAYVADVSNDYSPLGTVRVYFNCPVGDAATTLNWTASQPGPHVRTDDADLVTAPDAFDLASFIVLMNDFKTKFNAHMTAAGVHLRDDVANVVISPNAFDLQSATDILNEGQQKALNHFAATGVHTYLDVYNPFTFLFVPPASLGFAIAVMNLNLKPAYNNHLAAEFGLTFSGLYPFQLGGEIKDWSRLSISTPIFPQVFPALTPYTYYVDLHLRMNSWDVPVFIEATLTSDEGGSVTNPADYTGSITARMASSPATVLAEQMEVDRTAAILLDRDPLLESTSNVSLVRADGSELAPTFTRVFSTLPGIIWAFNQTVFSYSYHISVFASDGAGHQNTDTVNFPEYIVSPTLPAALLVVNDFVSRFNAHASSNVYHFQSDYGVVKAPYAVDMPTLVNLVAELRAKFLAHNFKLGPHSSPGWRIVSSRLYDMIVFGTDQMVDGEEYTFSADFKDAYVDNFAGDVAPGSLDRRLGRQFFHSDSVRFPVDGSASRPSLASALPRPGIIDSADGIHLETDFVEVFFSKPMHQVPLDSTNLILTGGSIVVKESGWTGVMTASIQVTSMEAVSYSLQAVGLTDSAGNPVFP